MLVGCFFSHSLLIFQIFSMYGRTDCTVLIKYVYIDITQGNQEVDAIHKNRNISISEPTMEYRLLA